MMICTLPAGTRCVDSGQWSSAPLRGCRPRTRTSCLAHGWHCAALWRCFTTPGRSRPHAITWQSAAVHNPQGGAAPSTPAVCRLLPDIPASPSARQSCTCSPLAGCPGAGRFSLTVRLLGSSSQPVLASLFGQLQAALDASKAAVEAGAAEGGAGQEQGEGGPPAAPSTHGMYTAEELSALAQQYGCKLPLSSS